MTNKNDTTKLTEEKLTEERVREIVREEIKRILKLQASRMSMAIIEGQQVNKD